MSTDLTPTYLYKLIHSSKPELLVIPLPDALPLNDRDAKDQFIHLATAKQVPLLIKKFFADEAEVFVLRLDYSVVEPRIKWQNSKGTADAEIGAAGSFGHIHKDASELKFGKQEVEGIFFLRKRGEAWADNDLKPRWLIY